MIVAHIDIPPSGSVLTVEVARALTDSMDILIVGMDEFGASIARAEEAIVDLHDMYIRCLDEPTEMLYIGDELNSRQFKSPPHSLVLTALEMLPGVDFPLDPG